MFGWLTWLFKKFVSPADFWPAPNSDLYIARFRKELNAAAKELARYGYPSIATRFTRKKGKCLVEFYGMKGVVAHVRVHGEMSGPDEVLVACNIPEIETVFSKFFPGLRVTVSSLSA